MTSSSFHQTLARLRHNTGVVIPVYLPQQTETTPDAALLQETVASYCMQVADPAAICLSVDGVDCGVNVAQRLSAEYGVSLCVVPDNRGKLWGAMHGARMLLDNPDLTYIAVVDQDGDHFANELLNFVRAADHIRTQTGDDGDRDGRVMVLGRRISLHRPMGFVRGELEALADRVLLDALHYHATVTDNPLRLEYATLLDETPDFQSGYKLFSRATAEAVFNTDTRQAGVSDTAYYRHACETVMSIEALESGARLGVVNRSTFNEQPVTHFGKLNQARATADMIIWGCKRLGIPYPFVAQWLANHAPRLLLTTIVPQGKEQVEQVRHYIGEAFAQASDETTGLQPLFV
ncbi:MAG: hypothetical protein JXR84_16315 [Anaerolineae bacterium]|nr:hypothetical protein [Anaerolineae bacterium]